MSYVWQDLVASDVVATLRGDYQLGIFFRVSTSPVLRWWLGINDIPAGFDSIDSGGSVYLGAGRLIGMPALEVLINGTSDKVEFTLSGVDVATGQQVAGTLPEVRGKAVHIGITTLDQYYQPVSAIIPLWTGTASHISKSIPVATGDQARSITLGLTATGGNNTRSRAAKVFWTNAHHQSEHPGDSFCAGTPRLARGVAPAFPRY